MIMRRAVITIVAVCFAVSSVAALEAGPNQQQTSVHAAEPNAQEPIKPKTKVNVTAVAARLIQEYVTPALCQYAPEMCNKLEASRGIQSYLATAGTMLGGVLGVILMKIKILIVLSLMTTIIGKLLLSYAFFHSGHYPHHGHYYHHKPPPLVKYTRDKYFIKHTPLEHSHDVVVEHGPHHSPYHGHEESHDRNSAAPSSGVSYYKR